MQKSAKSKKFTKKKKDEFDEEFGFNCGGTISRML